MPPETAPADVGANSAVNEVLPPAAIVAGRFKPLMPNPAPEAVAWEIVTLVVPEFDRVIVFELLAVRKTLPKLTLPGLAPSCPCTPVPLSPIVIGELEALLVKLTFPLTLPAAVGAKTTVNDVFAPAFRDTGKLRPLRLNPAPEAVAWEIVRVAFPEFESVTVCEPLPSTLTFPKLMLDGLAPSCPCVPAPVRDMESGEFDALLDTDRVPSESPVACGANWIWNTAFWPAPTVIGNVKPGALKLLFENVAWVTLMEVEPELLSVIVWSVVEPTATFPKARLAGAERFPSACEGFCEPLAPVKAQPVSPVVSRTSTATSANEHLAGRGFGRRPIPRGQAALLSLVSAHDAIAISTSAIRFRLGLSLWPRFVRFLLA